MQSSSPHLSLVGMKCEMNAERSPQLTSGITAANKVVMQSSSPHLSLVGMKCEMDAERSPQLTSGITAANKVVMQSSSPHLSLIGMKCGMNAERSPQLTSGIRAASNDTQLLMKYLHIVWNHSNIHWWLNGLWCDIWMILTNGIISTTLEYITFRWEHTITVIAYGCLVMMQ